MEILSDPFTRKWTLRAVALGLLFGGYMISGYFIHPVIGLFTLLTGLMSLPFLFRWLLKLLMRDIDQLT